MCSYSWSQESSVWKFPSTATHGLCRWACLKWRIYISTVHLLSSLLKQKEEEEEERKKESAKHNTLSHDEIWNVQILWRRYEFCQTKGFWRVICSFNASVQRFKIQTRAVVSGSTNGMIPRNRERQLQRFETIHLKGKVSRSRRSRWTTFWPVVCFSK